MSAIMGTFVKIGTMADGTPRIVLDLQCKLEDVAAMGLIPGVPFALARLKKESASPLAQPEAPKEKAGPLCIMACTFCADPMFLEWLNCDGALPAVCSELDAKTAILDWCLIKSRKELDTSARAAMIFHNRIRKPFLAWRDSANPRERAA